MNRIFLTSAAIASAAALAAVPGVLGLVGNPSFSHQLPVRVPSQAAHVLDRSSATQVADEHAATPGAPSTRTARPSATSTHVRHDDHGDATKHVEPGDDHVDATKHVEPGDDHGDATKHAEPGDDRDRTSSAGRAARDDGGRHDRGRKDDSGGDRRGSEDGGRHRGGKDG